VDVESQVCGKLLWIPSNAPDVGERRLWDRLSRFSPVICRTELQAVEAIRKHGISAAVANGPADGWEPAALLAALQAECPTVTFFLRDIRLPISKAVLLARKGAAGVYGAEVDGEAVAGEVESALEQRGDQNWRRNLIGTSPSMERICSLVGLVAERRGTVLLTGETGTGKEVLARAIHMAGKRSVRPFVAVNCSAIPGTLLESELFGHVRGAFTGANIQRIGRFEQAQGGTLFLDEIGDLDLELQTKLLRVLQEREMQRLGSSETIRLDVRVIAATHVDLAARIRERAFREDLYYRLSVIPIAVPPLRVRTSDIPLLAGHILRRICALEEIPLRTLSDRALMRLMEYSWPGNVRELENTLERCVALSGNRLLLAEEDFDLPSEADDVGAEADCDVPDCGFDFERAVSRFERNLLSKALRKAGGNKKAAADLLGLKRTTLAAKVKVLAMMTGEQAGDLVM
jgi:transcriptional regulator with GAF, ATPase, and Fis domain